MNTMPSALTLKRKPVVTSKTFHQKSYSACRTIKQFQNKQDDYEEYIAWFKNPALFYEANDFRAVHSC
jgi:hypothetical protein